LFSFNWAYIIKRDGTRKENKMKNEIIKEKIQMDIESKKQRVREEIAIVSNRLGDASIDIKNDRLYESTLLNIQRRFNELTVEYAQLVELDRLNKAIG
jgi:hypothetical protein